MTELKKVLITAGGTGGHVFPGLAVANYLRDRGIEVHWLGTSQGLESRVVTEAGYPLHLITIKGLRGKGLLPLLAAPFKVTKALLQSIRAIRKINPDVVIGMGGFVSGPGGMATWLLRKPLVIHEQNAKAGYTNKILARFAKKVLTGFPSAFATQANAVTVGNPVRAEIENIIQPRERLKRDHNSFRLLVLGGSLGAQALNEIVPRALAELGSSERLEVVHQAGDKHYTEAKRYYESVGIQANVIPFVEDMAQVYSWADMVLCRAGALTVSELCVAGLGAIFVPFPFAVDDHQTANASFMVNHQAALCVQQTDLTVRRLADIVREFSHSPDKRLAMAEAAYELRKVRVAEKIYEICREVCR